MTDPRTFELTLEVHITPEQVREIIAMYLSARGHDITALELEEHTYAGEFDGYRFQKTY